MSLAKIAEVPTSSILANASPSNKKRSDSSPASLSSPTKVFSQRMMSPATKVPKLNLAHTMTDDTRSVLPGSGGKQAMHAGEPVLKSPGSPSATVSTVRFASSPATVASTSAPSTPRTSSARHADEIRSPRRHRIESSPRKTTDGRRREADIGLQVAPSPRKLHDDLIALGTEAASLIFAAIRAEKPVLNRATTGELGRFEARIPIASLSPALRARITDEGGTTISHARLIKALFLPLLGGSAVGKTLTNMRLLVMGQYDGHQLTLVDREMQEEEHPGFKDRLSKNIVEHGKACAAVIFGLKAPDLSASQLPAELIAFWKAMDAELRAWAAQDPGRPAAELKKARANLGFDLLFTRLALPMCSGPKEEAGLAIPAMFFDSVKNALLADWPKFVDSFIQRVDLERSTATPVVPAPSTSSTSSTSSTADAAATPVVTGEADSGAEGEVFRQ